MDGAIHKKKINLAREIISLALREDLEPEGDLSTQCLDPEQNCQAQIIAKEPGIMSCSWLVELIFEEYGKLYPLSSKAIIKINCQDGKPFQTGDKLIEISANAKAMLACERSILNFLQRLSAIASKTQKLVELIADYDCKLLDTRKTMPGMRALEKQAFKDGGGTNHRFNLSDMLMLKENHLKLIDENLPDLIHGDKNNFRRKSIEVEINKDNLDKLATLIEAGVDQIMLDNFNPDETKVIASKAKQYNTKIKIEASGGINESNILEYAKTGVDYISTSICFTQAKNIDLSMLIK